MSKQIRRNNKKPKLPRLEINEKEQKLSLSDVPEDYFEQFGLIKPESVSVLLEQIINSSIEQNSSDFNKNANAALEMFHGINPTDKIESMLAIQMIACHNIALYMCKKTLLKEQTIDGINNNVNRTTKLMRTFATQMEAFKKYRTGGKQTIQVQHININEGGQAVVGDVNKRGG